MESNKSKIDELLRDKLGEHKIPFDESYWADAQVGIQKTNATLSSAKLGWIKVTGAMLLVAATSITSYLLVDKQSNTLPAYQTRNNEAFQIENTVEESTLESIRQNNSSNINTRSTSTSKEKRDNYNEEIDSNVPLKKPSKRDGVTKSEYIISSNTLQLTNNLTSESNKLKNKDINLREKVYKTNTILSDNQSNNNIKTKTNISSTSESNKINSRKSDASKNVNSDVNDGTQLIVNKSLLLKDKQKESISSESFHTNNRISPIQKVNDILKSNESTPLFLPLLSFNTPELDSQQILLRNDEFKLPKIKRDYWSIYGYYGYANAQLSSQDIGIETDRASESTYGIEVEIPIKKSRFGIYTGLNRTIFKESLTYNLNTLRAHSYYDYLDGYDTYTYDKIVTDTVWVQGMAFHWVGERTFQDSTYNPKHDSTLLTQQVEVDSLIQANNRIEYIEVPVMISYTMNFKKLQINTLAGVSLGKVTSGSGSIIDSDNNTLVYRYSDKRQLNDLVVNYQFRLKVSYMLQNNWGIYLEPYYKLGGTSLLNSSTGHVRKYNLTGLRGGVMLRF